MSGHSKWSKIKRKKGAADQKRSAEFAKLSKFIMIAAKDGPDPDMNPSLRTAIDKARAANVPKDKIEHAIKKGSGTLDGVITEEITYEGFGPHGIALIIQTVTDNKNRTVSDVKHALSEHGGNLGGSVTWMFEQKGAIHIDISEITEDLEPLELEFIEQGAEDIKYGDDTMIIYTDINAIKPMHEYMKAKELPVLTATPEFVAKEIMPLDDTQKEKVQRVIDDLEELDDVTSVFTNASL